LNLFGFFSGRSEKGWNCTSEFPGKSFTRHPFPGPGLAIRLLGAVTREKLEILKEADNIIYK
jgi:GMP synthase PP-ATPase subunit